MKLSELVQGEAGKFLSAVKGHPELEGVSFVVRSRIEGKKNAGSTVFYTWVGADCYKIYWKKDNPEVDKIGLGEIFINVMIHWGRKPEETDTSN